jgi:hypothetical protein
MFVPWGVVVCGLDDTSERRRGVHMSARGLDRDPVRSAHAHVVKVSGLRWLCGLLLTPRPWAGRIWALPWMTVLCPSERFDAPQGRRHQPLVERAWPIIHGVVRWWPRRDLVCVADRRDAVREWLHQVREWPRARLITRLRLDAALDDPPPPREPGQLGRPRLKGDRRPTLEAVWADEETLWSQLTIERWDGDAPREGEVAPESAVWSHSGKPPRRLRWVLIRDPHQGFEPQALWSTHLDHTPEQILTWCIRRWTIEVTPEEARAPLGLETPRQWKARAMARTTPALLSLSAIVTLTAHQLLQKEATIVRATAWYANMRPTCAEAMALVRRHLWDQRHFSTSPHETDMIQIPRVLFDRFIDMVCYAASLDKVELRSCCKIPYAHRFNNRRIMLTWIIAALLAVNLS